MQRYSKLKSQQEHLERFMGGYVGCVNLIPNIETCWNCHPDPGMIDCVEEAAPELKPEPVEAGCLEN